MMVENEARNATFLISRLWGCFLSGEMGCARWH